MTPKAISGFVVRLLVVLTIAGCSDDDAPLDAAVDAAPDAATYPIPEPQAPWNECGALDEHASATVVTVHDSVHQFWTGWDAGENQRLLDAEADLPESGPWRRIFLKVLLECPDGARCDRWDRSAAISLVENPGASEQPLELSRYMTPYGVGLCYLADVTHFSSLLRGRRTFRSFIDTWVGPGHTDGDGWQVTTTLIFHPGIPHPSTFASEVIPLWNNNAEDRITDLGDPGNPVSDQLPPCTVTIPADATGAALMFLLSGHGQGNLDNCAEWCSLAHTVSFGETSISRTPWREDCPSNPVSNQGGNWQPNRTGWCPGAWVVPEIVDITADLAAGQEFVFEYAVNDTQGFEYVNSCRPDAGDASDICTGCTFDQSAGNCDWDWSMHTPPYERIGVQLLIYR